MKLATKSQYSATARFHERMAAAKAAHGKTADAKAAKRAAGLCRDAAKGVKA